MHGRPFHTLALATATLAVCVACASTNSSPGSSTSITTRTLASPGPGVIETTDVNGTDLIRVKGSPGDAMSALAQIYADLQIPIATMIPDAGEIGNQHLRLPNHRLHGHLLSFYLNCGQESMVGSRADLDEVTMNVLSTIRQGKDAVTTVGTMVQGSARPSGTSSNPVDCQSTGELEKAIASGLEKSLGAPAEGVKQD